MGYPQTAVPPSAHSVWYSYSMHVNGAAIGSFERFGVRSTRTVEEIREILFRSGPEVTELVWGGTSTSIDLSFTELYQRQCFEAIGYNVYALEDMNFYFNITEIMTLPTSTGGKRIIEYMDCVASDWGKDLDVGGTKVVETITIKVRKVQGRRES